MNVHFRLLCQQCHREHSLTINDGDPFPLPRCSFCEGRFAIDAITVKGVYPDGPNVNHRVASNGKSLKLNIDESPSIDKIYSLHQAAHGSLAKPRLSGFMNRFVLSLLLVEVIRKSGGEARPIDVYDELLREALLIRASLLNLEKLDNIRRGERLSDGLPIERREDGTESFTPIAIRNLVGINQFGEVSETALPFVLGWVQYAKEEGLLRIVNEELANFEVTESLQRPDVVEGSRASIHRYLGIDESLLVVQSIVDHAPGEASLILFMLTASLKLGGWNSTGYAEEICKCEDIEAIAWWNDLRGRNAIVKELERSKRRKKRTKSTPQAKFISSINGMLGGAQQRVKELGLLNPKRDGNRKLLIPSRNTEQCIDFLMHRGVELPPLPSSIKKNLDLSE